MPDKKLTDSEVVKALKELLKELKGKKQLIVTEQGVKNLCYGLQNFLDLINRQDEEINRLQAENENYSKNNRQMTSDILKLYKELEQAKAENQRLKNAYKQCAWERDAYIEIENTAIAEVKAEAYKEFQEKLERTTWYRINQKGELVVGANSETDIPLYKAEDIYNLLKELVGEK